MSSSLFRYNIMLACWDKEPSNRPSFQQIIQLLDEIREGQKVNILDFVVSLEFGECFTNVRDFARTAVENGLRNQAWEPRK